MMQCGAKVEVLPKMIRHEMIYRIEQGLGTGAMPALLIQEGGDQRISDLSSAAWSIDEYICLNYALWQG